MIQEALEGVQRCIGGRSRSTCRDRFDECRKMKYKDPQGSSAVFQGSKCGRDSLATNRN